MEIAKSVSAAKDSNPVKDAAKINTELDTIAKADAEAANWDPVPDKNLDTKNSEWDDMIDKKDSAYCGVTLGGSFSADLFGGSIAVDTSDVFFEEPRKIAEDEDEEDDSNL